MNTTITVLGKPGTTISHMALSYMPKLFGIPEPISEGPGANCNMVNSNDQVIEGICSQGGFAIIAVETLLGKRVDSSIHAFGQLIKRYGSTEECPWKIAGAIELHFNFALMVKKGCGNDYNRIIAHEEAIKVCRKNISGLSLRTEIAPNNGEAARRVAEDPAYEKCAALAPASAAKIYDLVIVDPAFEKPGIARTTFFLLAPKEFVSAPGKKNRAVVVCEALDIPGSAAKVNAPFDIFDINMRLPTFPVPIEGGGENSYSFYLDLEMGEHQLDDFSCAVKGVAKRVHKMLVFDPFKIITISEQ